MTLPSPDAAASRPHCVLVVDDDRRVLELLQTALGAQGYRVVSASNGEDALRVAVREQPDLVVLDVRLPRKSGLEVCETLRQDPDDPRVPVILISALGDTEARIDGLARGADDFLAKPFSPRELIARVGRLLQRSDEQREAWRRNRDLEREVARAQEEVRRLNQQLRREQSVKEAYLRLGRELRVGPDRDAAAQAFLGAVRSRLGVGAGLLLAARASEPLRAWQTQGLAPERLGALAFAAEGELLQLVRGLGRPVRRMELERFTELAADARALAAAGIVVVAPLLSPRGLEGLLVADERPGGQEYDRADLEILGLMCDAAALVLQDAARFAETEDSWLAVVAALVSAEEARRGRPGHTERVARLCEGAAVELGLPAQDRETLRRAAWLHELGALLDGAEGQGAHHAGGCAPGVAERSGACLAALPGLEALGEVLAGGMLLPAPEPAARLAQVIAVVQRWEALRGTACSGDELRARLLDSDGAPYRPEVAEALLRALERGAGDLVGV
jgi:DNA-binding response OmpR family regulator